MPSFQNEKPTIRIGTSRVLHTGAKPVSRRRVLKQSIGAFLLLTGGGFRSPLSRHGISSQASELPLDLSSWSVGSLAKAIREKVVSSVEVVTAHVDRIAQVNDKINAVVAMAAERALAEARAADQALAQGKLKGPLHGVPITVKDSYETEGIISTAGTKGRSNYVPAQDATVVARLRAAGAIVLGKTNTPEFTIGGFTDNLVYGRTNNPFDLTRTPGGSSGGPAANVLVGGAPLDIGSDTSGSIRWPAHCCGVAGLKPTSGRASLAGHIPGPGGALGPQTQPGPIARFVQDLILALRIISGPDPRDLSVEDRPLGDPTSVDLSSLRIALHSNNGTAAPAKEIVQAVLKAARLLSEIAGVVDEKIPKQLREGPALDFLMFQVAGRTFFRGLLQAAGTPLSLAGPSLEYLANDLPMLSATQQADALAQRDSFKQGLRDFMQDYDVILCPVSSQLPPTHSQAEANSDLSYTDPYNLAGLPAAVVRAGTSSEGLPIGIQIVGRPWEEHVVLAVAQFLETALGGWQPVPPAILDVRRSAASWNVTWKGYGTLQSAANAEGPWRDVPRATSPRRVTNSVPSQFYRVRQ